MLGNPRGRSEGSGGRETTAANLERVGYGQQCSQERMANSSRREGGEPCYLALGMRGEGDRRLASVYKPDQRRQLQVMPTRRWSCSRMVSSAWSTPPCGSHAAAAGQGYASESRPGNDAWMAHVKCEDA